MAFDPCYRVASLMSEFNKPWFFAGGWAIDLFMGKQTRQHSDVEIAIFRQDQFHLKKYLKKWGFRKVVDGAFYPWENEFLKPPIHELHALDATSGRELEILMNERMSNEWKFRRNLNITLPIQSVWSYTNERIPYLNPEIVLLYKAKNTREKDHQDFITVKNHLSGEKKKWLHYVLHLQHPGHKWLQYLT